MAVAVLVVNDHALKAAWPGLVTGKLSDVAGVAMMGTLLTAATGRRSVGFGLTAIGFAALKTIPAVAVWAAPVLGGVTLTDRSDVVALLVLVPLWPWAAVSRSRPTKRLGAVSLPLRIAAVGAAVFATTATSCASSGVFGVAVQDDVFFAATSAGVWASSDGGVSWEDTGAVSWSGSFTDVDFGAERSCVADRCYELVRPSTTTVQVTVPGSVTRVDLVVGLERTSILSVAERDLDGLHEVVSIECGPSTLTGIAATGIDDGDVVVVAMGDAGVMRRPSDGDWEWVAVGEHGIDDPSATPLGVAVASASPGPGFAWPLWLSRGLLVAVPLVAASTVHPIAALARRRGRDADAAAKLATVIAVMSGLLVVAVLVLAERGDFAAVLNAVGAVLIGGGTALALAALAVAYGRRSPTTLLPPRADQRAG